MFQTHADGRAWRVHSIVWGTAYPLVMRALPRGHVDECLRAWGRCHKHVWVPCASPNSDFGSYYSKRSILRNRGFWPASLFLI